MNDDASLPLVSPSETEAPFDWRSELTGLALMLLAVLSFHSFLAKPFYIPSASMAPGLWVGDRLVVSKYPYGWNWTSFSFHILPRASWHFWQKSPEYGDIVIVVPRGSQNDYIKRVVALAGDRIALVNGQIILNGKKIPQEVEPPQEVPIDALASSEDPSPCTGFGSDGMWQRKASGQVVCQMPIFRETMPNGATYRISDHMSQAYDNMNEITIPADHVFVMGDNRDHSADSRVPLEDRGLGGPVPLTDIGGRAEFLTFSLDNSAGWNPKTWLSALRHKRGWATLRPAINPDGITK